MKYYTKILLAGLTAFGLSAACSSKPTEVAPAKLGERGTACEAKNDCGESLSCINRICLPANFDISSTNKECYSIDCEAAVDCCGDKSMDAPAKCRERAVKCEPRAPRCDLGASCDENSECNGGTCGGFRRCDASGQTCSDAAPCAPDTCEFISNGLGGAQNGRCSLSRVSCTGDGDCTTANECGGGACDCTNPDYDPTDPICSDAECDDICTLTCDDRQCVEDNSCKEDSECVVGDRDKCDAGECVECKAKADCDDADDEEDDDDVCLRGECITPCQGDTECGRMQACEAGECVYKGCRSDRECVLGREGNDLSDSRLSKCVVEDGLGQCKISCQIDAHCSSTEICSKGACQYIGCDNDVECKNVLGLHNEETSDDKPWITKASCEVPPAPLVSE